MLCVWYVVTSGGDCVNVCTHHCENKPWLLNTLSLHHLEDIHHTLTLAAVNGGSYGTEHS